MELTYVIQEVNVLFNSVSTKTYKQWTLISNNIYEGYIRESLQATCAKIKQTSIDDLLSFKTIKIRAVTDYGSRYKDPYPVFVYKDVSQIEGAHTKLRSWTKK